MSQWNWIYEKQNQCSTYTYLKANSTNPTRTVHSISSWDCIAQGCKSEGALYFMMLEIQHHLGIRIQNTVWEWQEHHYKDPCFHDIAIKQKSVVERGCQEVDAKKDIQLWPKKHKKQKARWAKAMPYCKESNLCWLEVLNLYFWSSLSAPLVSCLSDQAIEFFKIKLHI